MLYKQWMKGERAGRTQTRNREGSLRRAILKLTTEKLAVN